MRLDRSAVHALLRRVRGGTLTVVDGLGSETFGDGDGRADVKVEITDLRTYGAVLRSGGTGLGEAYADGWWSTDDLGGLMALVARNSTMVDRYRDTLYRYVLPLVNPIRRLRRPDLDRDRRDVQAHYDVSNDFFALFLDETMTYSCARFDEPGATLAQAQRAKLELLCEKLELTADDHLVEIGTGWGSMALHAAGTRGCRVTTTTISDAQRELATRRVADADLADRVTVLGEDYRQLGGTYDKLVSVEMLEAVDWREQGRFFSTCSRLLRPDGVMALQAIVAADQSYERVNATRDFLKTFIFPGGCLPSITSIARDVTRATDMRIVHVEDQTEHYVRTLQCWRANLLADASRLTELGLDDRFRRLWEFYFAYCEGGFAERHAADVQMVLVKPGWRPPP